jgi:hypothetical protein
MGDIAGPSPARDQQASFMPSRHGLSIRPAQSGHVEGLAQLLAAAGQGIARDRLVSRLSALQDQPGLAHRRGMGAADRDYRGALARGSDGRFEDRVDLSAVGRSGAARNGVARRLLRADGSSLAGLDAPVQQDRLG